MNEFRLTFQPRHTNNSNNVLYKNQNKTFHRFIYLHERIRGNGGGYITTTCETHIIVGYYFFGTKGGKSHLEFPKHYFRDVNKTHVYNGFIAKRELSQKLVKFEEHNQHCKGNGGC